MKLDIFVCRHDIFFYFLSRPLNIFLEASDILVIGKIDGIAEHNLFDLDPGKRQFLGADFFQSESVQEEIVYGVEDGRLDDRSAATTFLDGNKAGQFQNTERFSYGLPAHVKLLSQFGL